MTTQEVDSLVCLQLAVHRLNEVLVPWGFLFHHGETDSASAGGYATGWYRRGSIRILLIWRANIGLGCVSYEHDEVFQQGELREQIAWGLGHPGFMQHVGHADDCQLIENGISSVARDGGDPSEAFANDLREYAAALLSTENAAFVAMLKKGYRRREVH